MSLAELIEYMAMTSIEALMIKKFGKMRVQKQIADERMAKNRSQEDNNNQTKTMDRNIFVSTTLELGRTQNIKSNLDSVEIAQELHCSTNLQDQHKK
ncbi:MAG: hypothetical protein H6625_02350 [Bdellovibrionaceae bacterium]|nr:hypothetical protein [Pseudobdellovibrionaceae bacterium]